MNVTLKRINLIYIFIFILLILIAGFRLFGWANDTSNYYEMAINQDVILLSKKELFFKFLIFINTKLFYRNFTSFLLIFALLGVSIKLYAFTKLSPIPILSIILYILSYFWLHEYIQIRAGVATGIFLLATKDLSEGNTRKYFIKTFLAIMFHWSSIVLIPLYFLVRKMSIKLIALFPALGIFLYLIGFDFNILIDYVLNISGIDPALYYMYAGYKNEINVFNPIAVSYLLIFLGITLLLFRNRYSFSEYEVTLYKIFSIGIFIFFLTSLLHAPVVAFRLLEYFNIILLILLPFIVLKFKQKIFISTVFISYFSVYTYFLFTKVIVFN